MIVEVEVKKKREREDSRRRDQHNHKGTKREEKHMTHNSLDLYLGFSVYTRTMSIATY